MINKQIYIKALNKIVNKDIIDISIGKPYNYLNITDRLLITYYKISTSGIMTPFTISLFMINTNNMDKTTNSVILQLLISTEKHKIMLGLNLLSKKYLLKLC